MTAKLQAIIDELHNLPLEELAKIVVALEKKLNLANQLNNSNEQP